MTGGANVVQDNSALSADPYCGNSAGFVQVQSDSEANALLAGITAHVVVGTKTYNLNYNGDNTNSQFFAIADAAPATPDHLNFNLLLNDPSKSLNVSAAVQARPEITAATGFDVNNSDLAANNISLPLLTSQTFWAVVDPRTGYAKVDLTGELSVPLKKGEVTWTASAPAGDDIAIGISDGSLMSKGTSASGTLNQLNSGVGNAAIYFKPGATDASNALSLKLGFDMNHDGTLSGPGTEVVYSGTVKTIDLLSTGINVSVGGSQVSTTATDLNTPPLQFPSGNSTTNIKLTISTLSPGQRNEALYEIDDANTGAMLTSGNFSTQPINYALPSGIDNVFVRTGVRMGSDTLAVPSQGVDLYRYGVNSVTATPPQDAVEGKEWTGDVGTFTSDAGASPADFNATIDWADGSPTEAGTIRVSGGTFTISGTHTYAEETSGTFEVSVAPKAGPVLSDSGPVTVADAPITAVAHDIRAKLNVDDSFLVGTITDSNPSATADDFLRDTTIDWGDGMVTLAERIVSNGDGSFDVYGSHTYTSANGGEPYVLGLAAVDDGGATASAEASAEVAEIESLTVIGGSPGNFATATDSTVQDLYIEQDSNGQAIINVNGEMAPDDRESRDDALWTVTPAGGNATPQSGTLLIGATDVTLTAGASNEFIVGLGFDADGNGTLDSSEVLRSVDVHLFNFAHLIASDPNWTTSVTVDKNGTSGLWVKKQADGTAEVELNTDIEPDDPAIFNHLVWKITGQGADPSSGGFNPQELGSPPDIIKLSPGDNDFTLTAGVDTNNNGQMDDTAEFTVNVHVIGVQLAILDNGTITPAPENSTHDADVGSAGGVDNLGSLNLGQGRWENPGNSYINAVENVAALSGSTSNLTFQWQRTMSARFWRIHNDGTQWVVTQLERYGVPQPVDDMTDNNILESVIPSPLNKLYTYDPTGVYLKKPAGGSGLDYSSIMSVHDYVYVEKQFHYTLNVKINGTSYVLATMDEEQIIEAQRTNDTGTVANDWSGLQNLYQEGQVSLQVTDQKIRQVVQGSQPILIDSHANE